jgi:uncharacterized protein involved in exopolysaccharide biosynthesis
MKAYWTHSLGTVLVIVALAALGIHWMPSTYTASAVLLVEQHRQPLTAAAEGGAGTGYTGPTQLVLITGTGVLQPVIDTLDLTHDQELVAGFEGPPAALRQRVLTRLQSVLTVIQDPQDQQRLRISAFATSPNRAAAIANAVAREYIRQMLDSGRASYASAAERYRQDLLELRRKVDTAQEQLNALHQQGGQIDRETRKLADAEQTLLAAQSTRHALEADPSQSADLVRARQLEAVLQGAADSQRARLTELRDQESALLLALQSAQEAYRVALNGATVEEPPYSRAAVTLLESARPPGKASSPDKGALFLLACAVALGVGLAWPALYERLAGARAMRPASATRSARGS